MQQRALAFCLEFLDVELHSWSSLTHTFGHQEISDKRLLTVQHRPAPWMHRTYLINILHMHSKINTSWSVGSTHINCCTHAVVLMYPRFCELIACGFCYTCTGTCVTGIASRNSASLFLANISSRFDYTLFWL